MPSDRPATDDHAARLGQPGLAALLFAVVAVVDVAGAGAAAGAGDVAVPPSDEGVGVPDALSVVVAEAAAPSALGAAEAAAPSALGAADAAALLDAWTLSRWSFFAQPDPLNTMAGVESALRIAEPQRSQVLGPSAV